MISKINISSFSDSNYIQHTCVMLKSILQARNLSREYSIYFFYSECPDILLEKVRNEFAGVTNFSLTFIECNNYKQYSSRLKLNHYSMAIYAKVFLYDLLPADVKKTLFFDSDIVLISDPAELFDTELGDYTIGAVTDSYYPSVPEKMKNALKLESETDYFNSGVLIVNVEKWKKHKISEKAIQFLVNDGHKTLFHDQDGFNYAFHGKWKRIDPYWNPSTTNRIINEKGEEVIIPADKIYKSGKARLIHYHGSNKPWLYFSDHPMKNLYLDILSQTSFAGYTFPDKNIQNVLKKQLRKLKKQAVKAAKAIRGRR